MVIPDRHFIAPFLYSCLLFGWFCAIVLSPLYIFDSGLPQPSDFLLIGVCSFCLFFYLATRKIIISDIGISLFLIVVLFAFINGIYGSYYGDVRFYYSAAYYIFNAIVFAGTVILFMNRPQCMARIVRCSVYVSIVLEILFIIFADSHSPYRETGSFNNPNQLGYWALLNAAILIVLNVNRRMSFIDFIFFGLCGTMIILSMSRAAIVGLSVLFFAVFFSKQLSLHSKAVAACVISMFLIGIILVPSVIPDISFYPEIGGRFSPYDPDNDFIGERGYERITDNPHYLLYGAGEGAYWRFSDMADTGIELHSGLATILFSYGILGAMLFVVFLYNVLRRSPPVILCTIFAVMLYGMTHQNIRFTGFWVYLAVIYAMTAYKVNTTDENANHA